MKGLHSTPIRALEGTLWHRACIRLVLLAALPERQHGDNLPENNY